VAVLAAAGLMVGAATGGALLAVNLDDDDAGPATSSLSGARPAVDSQGDAPDEPLSQAAAAVLPSVVSITFESNLGAGQGSGVVISSDGQILTNNHVVAEAADGGRLSVTFSDGSDADARILGRDPATDLAVIQAEDVSGLTEAKLGSSADLHVGDTVLAIGSPLGLDGSVSAGIVSALDRSITLSNDLPESPFGNGGQRQAAPSAVIDAIQTDAAINPGNSGGALINADGEVVGINTAIASLAGGSGAGSQGGNIGVGFAIPIDSARSIAEQLVENGEVTHAFLGVRIADAENGGGAVVGQVDNGQPADDAGIEQGDVITKVDDTEITSGSDLTSAIRSHRPGDKVTITYTRDGDNKTTEVTLGELPTD
jgi:putative serine protease PepD